MPAHGQTALNIGCIHCAKTVAPVIEQVPMGRIGRYSEYFPGPQPEMVIASVAEGNTEGQLWVGVQPGDRTVALLWDKGNNVFYLGGQLASAEATRHWALLINGQVKQLAIKQGLARFKVRALSPSLEMSVRAVFQGVALREYVEFFFSLKKDRPSEIPSPSVGGVEFQQIDRELLGRRELRNLEPVRSEIRWMWPSEERFCERGFGCAALHADEVIGWCTAEYVSQNACGIGIATEKGYENKGVGTATAARFVEECVRRRVKPHWECGAGNLGSIRLAEKVGFERLSEVKFWAGMFGE